MTMMTTKEALSEEAIIQLMKSESEQEQALKALMEQYHDRLYWQVRHIVLIHEDADDVLQQVWMKVYRHMARFEARSSLHTWLYRIAHNEAIGLLRKKKRYADHYDEEVHQLMVERVVADPYFDGDAALASLHAATMQLTDKQREVFTMKYFQHMTYEQISETVGTTVGGLKALYHHARKQIERHITEHANQSPL